MDEKKIKKKKEKAVYDQNYEQLYNCCKDLADIYLRDENNELALQEYKEAEKTAQKLGNIIYVAIANRMIGETLCALGEFEEAIKHQNIHLNYSRDEGNLVEEQRALATIGRTYFVKAESITSTTDPERKHCLELCRKYYLKSLSICERLSATTQLSQKTLAEMKLRLFLNLGLSFESQGDTLLGIDYISKAINICKHLELWEDLTRCYMSQGSLYFRLGNTAKALLLYDEGLKVAERIERKIQMSCELLSLKADVLIALSDYKSAKSILIKAYKMKTSDNKERSDIEKKLKTIVLICKSENELLKSDVDYITKKKLNETLGDCCVKLKNYDYAINYYLKMLECSIELGVEEKDLTPIYFSLSQTYKDNKQYELAMEYSEKEFNVIKDNPAEACKTLLSQCEILELMKGSFDKIMEYYRRALIFAKHSGDLKLEVLTLQNMKNTQLEYNRDDLATITQNELNIVKCCITNEELDDYSEDSDEIQTPDDINLEELSDFYSDDEEQLLEKEKHPRRKITKTSLTKRNEKGETPLHVASAKGNIQLIKNLISQGHPVNIQDAAGWSPLHEACNHGQVEAAKILIESGAYIDDRGGPCCDGITPLLDAACNGHLEIITLLLDKGASPLVRSNQGETVLDCLLACQERATAEGETMDSVTQVYFEAVVKRLKDSFNKVGQNPQKYHSLPKNTNRIYRDRNEWSRTPKLSNAIDHSRKKVDLNLIEESSTDATREYQIAMEALRHRYKNNISCLKPVEKTKKPALLTDEDIGDNWLENDVDNQDKRPTKRRCEQFIGLQLKNSNACSISEFTNKPSTSFSIAPNNHIPANNIRNDVNKELKSLKTSIQLPDDSVTQFSEDISFEDDNDFVISQNFNTRPERRNQQLKYQKSLLSVGFTRFNPPVHNTQDDHSESSAFDISNQRNDMPAAKLINQCSNSCSIKVRIEGKLFLVPVPKSQNNLNVGWLTSEASRRYQNLEGISPELQLTTEDGALLDINDPISIVMNESEICASVLNWNAAPLIERYNEICSAANTNVDHFLKLQLNICQASSCLKITDCSLSLTALSPVLKTISHYQNLQKICMSGIYLQDQGFKTLIDHISKLQQIHSLDVSVNNITNDGLSYFKRILSLNLLQNLQYLDFSYNPLGEESVSNLVSITHYLHRLQSLNLKFVGFTVQSLYIAENFMFENLESLDVSYNNLEREGAAKFLSALNSNIVKSLNLSDTAGSEVFRECLLFLDSGLLYNLEELFLSNLDLDDEDVEKIVQPLLTANHLVKLDLSNNARITFNSYKSLSSLKNLKQLDLTGCGQFTIPHELNLPFCKLYLSGSSTDNDLKQGPYNYITNIVKSIF